MELKCEFNCDNCNREYECRVENAKITIPGQVIKVFKGKHLFGKTNEDVEILEFIHGTMLQYIPRDLNEHFPNLKQLNFHYCGIQEISRQDLRGLEMLEIFWMDHCKLTSLPDDLLINMPSLINVSFENNLIVSASSNLLKPFIGRSEFSIYLKGNVNIDACYSSKYIRMSTHKSLKGLMEAIDRKCINPIHSKVVECEDFNEGIKKLWTSGCFSDIKFISGDKQFNVHRSVLGIRSSLIAKIFEDHKDATEIKVSDFSPIAVESLLRFIYTKEFIHEDNAIENFIIAHKFNIQKMKLGYEKILSEKLDESNAYETLLLAHQHKAEGLKKKAFKLISDQFPTPLPEKLKEDHDKLKKLIDNRREYKKLVE